VRAVKLDGVFTHHVLRGAAGCLGRPRGAAPLTCTINRTGARRLQRDGNISRGLPSTFRCGLQPSGVFIG
jgi:hypothetical protein